MSEIVVETFLPADPRWNRPYLRVGPPDGLGQWYCWATERGGGWLQIAGPPYFDLRSTGYLESPPAAHASSSAAQEAARL